MRADEPMSEVVEIDGIPIDSLTLTETADRITEWAVAGSGGYVTTPNVDHIVKARRDAEFRRSVLGARLRVPDGMGIVYGARLAGTPLRGTVTGRLLPEEVGRRLTGHGIAIALFGGPPGTAERAATILRERQISVAAAFSPPMDLTPASAADRDSVDRLKAAGAGVIFVGLGAPKQELWMARHAAELPGTVLVGVGAAIDVLAGRVRPAPAWMTRVGLEWLFRLAQQPRRLARRYLWDDPRYFLWMLRARLRRKAPG